jgi:pantothenate kinase-related protein Tda10
VLSLDDLYHTNAGLKKLAARHPEVKLLHGRGQPGTHEIDLATSVLEAVSRINESGVSVDLPIFDKSLYGGEGDRSQESVLVEGPLDVFILEGWSMGFQPLSAHDLERAYKTSTSTSSTPIVAASDSVYFAEHSLSSLHVVNDYLSTFATAVYPFFNVFVQIEPTTYQSVFMWRLEQEHAMKAANGGRGMTDEEVRAFVKRYMPGYELWKEGIWNDESSPWRGRGLRLFYDPDRKVTTVEYR